MGIKVTHSKTKKPIKQMPAQQKVRPFNMRTTPFNPLTGKYMPLQGSSETDPGIPLEVKIVAVASDQGDYLVCADLFQQGLAVAKPYLLRRTPFDGETVNSITYTYYDAATRLADDGDATETQYITPSYYVGEQLLVIAHRTYLETDTGSNIVWEDMNTAGKSWAVGDDVA